jgi:hypothetical protein
MSQKVILGRFLFNSKGEVVGMIVGAVKRSAVVGGEEIFSKACFIITEDGLRWATKVLGEGVAFLSRRRRFNSVRIVVGSYIPISAYFACIVLFYIFELLSSVGVT